MTYWIVWRDADGIGTPVEEFACRSDAVTALLEQASAAADAIEHGTGKKGTWSWDEAHLVATLWCDDMFHDERPLGHYVIEQVATADTDGERTP